MLRDILIGGDFKAEGNASQLISEAFVPILRWCDSQSISNAACAYALVGYTPMIPDGLYSTPIPTKLFLV